MKSIVTTCLSLLIVLGAQAQTVIITYAGGYRGNLIDTRQIEAGRLTHVLYAFATLESNRAVLKYPKTDALNLQRLAALKQLNPRIKLLLSVGGLGWSRNFSDMALTENGRQAFAQSCLKLVKQFRLDGIDIDWEFPGYPGGGGNIYRPEDKRNYTLLFKTLRQALPNYQLTTAVDGWATHFLPHSEMDQVAQYVDYVCLMTYNFNSGGMAGGHFLYSPPNWDPAGSVVGAVKAFLAAGVPKEKLVIGVGFFPAALRMRSNDPGDRHYLAKLPFRGGLTKVYRLAAQKSYGRYWDTVGQAPYLFNPQTRVRIAYEDIASVKAKFRYIQQQHLAGLMYWDYFSDPGQRLLKAITDP
ncbi:glycoside hydrolase family 18 protein [Mucilaginibacter sp.]|uniref:glycoside hydrolase family 18 protein n=1 Tax=Mucilaginibacter sp. TaxID=1882438 RepID=UPI002616D815|nr:glycosyl hydrolase family 18 protein [Mucilaginibacter sp.]MDB4924434.1 chitinase [Mucilaginibacter sp.]